MIVDFAKSAPEEVRAMFIALFDENNDVFERIEAFKLHSLILLEKFGDGAVQHYQHENAISVYLWLRYPDFSGFLEPSGQCALADAKISGSLSA